MGRYNTVLSSASTATGTALASPNQGLFTTITGGVGIITLTDPNQCLGSSQGFWNTTGAQATLTTPSGTIKGPNVNSAVSYVMSNNSVVFLTSVGTDYVVSGQVSGLGFINVDVASATYTASASQLLWVNTTSTVITVTLPVAPLKGDTIRIVDIANTFNTNNLTLARNGQPIMSDSSGNMTVATQGAAFDLIYYDATRGWRIFTI